MDQPFIFIADEAVADPRLLREAVDAARDYLTIAQAVAESFGQRLHQGGEGDDLFFVWLLFATALRCGGVVGYAQSKFSKRWARIPQSYWEAISPEVEIPTYLSPEGGSELSGQPIVVAEEGLHFVLAMVSDFLEAAKAVSGKAAGGVPPLLTRPPRKVRPHLSPGTYEDFFRERWKQFEGQPAPVWSECYQAAKERYEADYVVDKDELLTMRRRFCPAWSKPGPRSVS